MQLQCSPMRSLQSSQLQYDQICHTKIGPREMMLEKTFRFCWESNHVNQSSLPAKRRCQVIFLVEGPLVRIRMAITQGASWLFFLKCVCVCFGGWSRVTLTWCATGEKHRSWHWALKVEDLNYSPL